MDIGFETIGNATLIVYENNFPLISTDVWFDEDPAYFGSWRLSHKIPTKQRESLIKSKYIYISHFHPDHLNIYSLRKCIDSTIIIAQHYGERVEKDLRNMGFTVLSLPSRKWISIGKRTRIILFNNELQDSAILIELTDNRGNKTLLLNLNDSAGIGFEREVSNLSRKYERSFYLALHCWGDADMINLFNGKGERIEPLAAKKFPVGKDIKRSMRKFNANIAIPFSHHHQYQRKDSFWANEYVTPLSKVDEGFISDEKSTLLPAFQRVQLRNGSYKTSNINPEKLAIEIPINEREFGDDWDQKLNESQIRECKQYFQSITTLFSNYKSISINVGGIKHEMLKDTKGNAIIEFYCPSNSLINAIRREIFDDLLIGNFMKTTIKKGRNLYDPDFTLRVSKYSDNGGVKTTNELQKYFNYYNHNRIGSDKFFKTIRTVRRKTGGMINNEFKTKLKYLFRR